MGDGTNEAGSTGGTAGAIPDASAGFAGTGGASNSDAAVDARPDALIEAASSESAADGHADTGASADAASDVVESSTSSDGGSDAADAAPSAEVGLDSSADAGFDGDASTPRYAWVSIRVDDCAGLDDGALGYTSASDTPVASNCNATTVGRAVQPGCTYKTVQSSACTQGPRPGYLWVCVDHEDGGVVDNTPSPDFGNWRFVRIGDCAGNDNATIGYTTTSKLPLGVDCTAANRGYAAVCWDQVNHSNPGVNSARCTYKNITAASCTGGSNPGALYVCNAP